MRIVKKIALIFLLGFLFNMVWENFHHYFYIHYQGQEITQLILIRAALFDASFIALVGLLFLKNSYFQKRLWLAVAIGVAFAISLEIFALSTNRWAYNELMPIIPIIKTGLTPTIQLGLLSYLAYKIVGVDKAG